MSNSQSTGPGYGNASKKRKAQELGSKSPFTIQSTERKRNNAGNTNEPTGRDAKRRKMHAERELRAQSAEQAFPRSEISVLPFVAARQTAIANLEDGIRRSRAVSARRAFQKLPRDMRRRTASHNVKRLPKRLRGKATWEMCKDKTPLAKRKKLGEHAKSSRRLKILAQKKRKREARTRWEATEKDVEGQKTKGTPVVTREAKAKTGLRPNHMSAPRRLADHRYTKRQRIKAWLPTHLWHAKRSTMSGPMEALWGFAMPLTPTQKCYRPTHQASCKKGCVVWDASYMATIQIMGTYEGIEKVLREHYGVEGRGLWEAKSPWLTGHRSWQGVLTTGAASPEGAKEVLAPALIFWNALENKADETGTSAEELDTSTVDPPTRQLLIRVHPACFKQLWKSLLRTVRKQPEPRPALLDLRFEMGSIELIGPDSIEALLNVLRPQSSSENRKQHAQIVSSLAHAKHPDSLLKDSVWSYPAIDPRLHYPPQKYEFPSHVFTPTSDPAPTASPLFRDPSTFLIGNAFPLLSDKEIYRRRKSRQSNRPLKVKGPDPAIPIILLNSGQIPGTPAFVVLAPWTAILHIWHSLVHVPLSTGGNPRVGGLDELRQVAFENSTQWFPGDFPYTEAGAQWEAREGERLQKEWEARPASKRVSWKAIDLGAGRIGELGCGFACDWRFLFGMKKPSDSGEMSEVEEEKTMTETKKKGTKPIFEFLSNKSAADHQFDNLKKTKKRKRSKGEDRENLFIPHLLPRATFEKFIKASGPSKLPERNLIAVRIQLYGRGTPARRARIYRLPTSPKNNPALPTTQIEVPGTLPSDTSWITDRLVPQDFSPARLLDMWLAKLPPKAQPELREAKAKNGKPFPNSTQVKSRDGVGLLRVPPEVDAAMFPMELTPGQPFVPDERDLMGFVTEGAFNLREGKGTGVGCLDAKKAVAERRGGYGGLCVVREAGEGVGRLGCWRLI